MISFEWKYPFWVPKTKKGGLSFCCCRCEDLGMQKVLDRFCWHFQKTCTLDQNVYSNSIFNTLKSQPSFWLKISIFSESARVYSWNPLLWASFGSIISKCGIKVRSTTQQWRFPYKQNVNQYRASAWTVLIFFHIH